MKASDFWKVDYSNCYFIQGCMFKGDYFRDIPEFPVMLGSLEEAQTAALAVIKDYAAIRIMKEEMLVGRLLEPSDYIEAELVENNAEESPVV